MNLLVEDDPEKVFEFIKEKLLAQGCRSYGLAPTYLPVFDGKKLCLYRGPNNTRCAAGHLIPDEVYSENMESVPAYHISFFKENYPKSMNVIEACQIIHDNCRPIEWKIRFEKISINLSKK